MPLTTIEINGIDIKVDDFVRLADIRDSSDLNAIEKARERLTKFDGITLDASEAYKNTEERILLLLQIKYLIQNNTIINARMACNFPTDHNSIYFTHIYDALSNTEKKYEKRIIGVPIRKFINNEGYRINPWRKLGSSYGKYGNNNSLRALIEHEKKFLGGFFVQSGRRGDFLWTPTPSESDNAINVTSLALSNNSAPIQKDTQVIFQPSDTNCFVLAEELSIDKQSFLDSSSNVIKTNGGKGVVGSASGIESIGRGQESPLSSLIPPGNPTPEKEIVPAPRHKRDPDVTRWIRDNANGKCENCDKIAPFKSLDGSPYLEIHHVIWLRDGGPDTVCNAIAACPNCHRELHHGIENERIKDSLYSKIPRLIRR